MWVWALGTSSSIEAVVSGWGESISESCGSLRAFRRPDSQISASLPCSKPRHPEIPVLGAALGVRLGSAVCAPQNCLGRGGSSRGSWHNPPPMSARFRVLESPNPQVSPQLCSPHQVSSTSPQPGLGWSCSANLARWRCQKKSFVGFFGGFFFWLFPIFSLLQSVITFPSASSGQEHCFSSVSPRRS